MVGKMMRWEVKGLDALILPLTVTLKIEGEKACAAVEMRKHTSPSSCLWHTIPESIYYTIIWLSIKFVI